jgi:hypothetical protein
MARSVRIIIYSECASQNLLNLKMQVLVTVSYYFLTFVTEQPLGMKINSSHRTSYLRVHSAFVFTACKTPFCTLFTYLLYYRTK